MNSTYNPSLVYVAMKMHKMKWFIRGITLYHIQTSTRLFEVINKFLLPWVYQCFTYTELYEYTRWHIEHFTQFLPFQLLVLLDLEYIAFLQHQKGLMSWFSWKFLWLIIKILQDSNKNSNYSNSNSLLSSKKIKKIVVTLIIFIVRGIQIFIESGKIYGKTAKTLKALLTSDLLSEVKSCIS